MSTRFLKSALYSAHKLFQQPNRLSYQTQADYEKNTKLFLKQLHKLGVAISDVKHLKKKQVKRLVDHWQQQNLSPRTLKNRLAIIRYIVKALDKPQILPKTNHELGVDRLRKPVKNRAIHQVDASKIKDPFVRFSVKLQKAFGLRREESLKFIPSHADRGNHLALKGSWTKGGIARKIPITTSEQRELLEQLREWIPKGHSLISDHKNYREQLNVYVTEIQKAGFQNLHGLRHAYAQKRYRVLTDQTTKGNGWECPLNGGLKSEVMTRAQKDVDHRVRMTIANELGHSRKSITRTYLG